MLKQLLVVLCFLIIGVAVILPAIYKSKYMKAESMDINGVVTHIEWESRNHALPLFQIQNKDGSTYSFNDGELELKEGQLEVGNTIIKKAGDRYCSINEVVIECISEFVGFSDAFYKAINSNNE